jgi:hypothetical protein
VQVFTANGTYTPSPNLVSAIVECVGGGGGGGGVSGTANNIYVGGGGGAGGYSRSYLTAAQIGSSQTITVGGGGGAGGGAGSGAPGADSSFGTFCIAKAGQGGTYSSSGSNGIGGAGGVAGTGDIKAAGSPGHGGFYNSVNATIGSRSGAGGSSAFGGGAVGSAGGSGNPAGNYGGGGSGATSSGTGDVGAGNGSSGIVIVTEYVALALPPPNYKLGVMDGSNAAAGEIGECVQTTATQPSYASGAWTGLTSLVLSAGDWDVSATSMLFTNTAPGSWWDFASEITTNSSTGTGNLPNNVQSQFPPVAGRYNLLSIPPVRFSLTSSTTIYLQVFQNSVQGLDWKGSLHARRMR